jgi:hypothetical protein
VLVIDGKNNNDDTQNNDGKNNDTHWHIFQCACQQAMTLRILMENNNEDTLTLDLSRWIGARRNNNCWIQYNWEEDNGQEPSSNSQYA